MREMIAKYWPIIMVVAIGAVAYMELKKPEYKGADLAGKLKGLLTNKGWLIAVLGLSYFFVRIKH